MPQARGGEIGDEGGGKTGEESLIADSADREDFDAEEGAGEGGSEDGGKAGGDAGHEQNAAVARCEDKDTAEDGCELIGERGTGLDGGAFPAGGAAEEMGEKGAEEDKRRHARGDGGGGRVGFGVDLFEEQVVAGFDGSTEVVVKETDGEAGEWEEVKEPGVGFARACGPVKRDEEKCRGGAGEEAYGNSNDEPKDGVTEGGAEGVQGVADGGNGHGSPTKMS